MQIEILYMNGCYIVGCYGKRLEIANINLNMNLCVEYQSE